MLFYAVLFCTLQWKCIGGENIENISIESILDQVAIPTKIINDFLQKPRPTLSPKTANLAKSADTPIIRYGNSNGFLPLVVSTQPYEFQQTQKNFTKFNTNNLNRNTLNKNSSKTEILIEKKLLNVSNLNKNRRFFYTDNKRNEFEQLKISNRTPSIINYSSQYENSPEFYISDQYNSNTNLSKPLRIKELVQRNRVKNDLSRHNSIDHASRQQLRTASSENKNFNFDEQENVKSYYTPDRIKTYDLQKVSLPKTNYDTLNQEKSGLKSYTNIDKNEEYTFNKSIIPIQNNYKENVELIDQSQQNIVSSYKSNDSERRAHRLLKEVEWINRNYEFTDSQDTSEENLDYTDEIGKPRRIQKLNNKRLRHNVSSRKVPKEHRQINDDAFHKEGRKHSAIRLKSRFRQKPLEISNYDKKNDNEESSSEENYSDFISQQNFDKGNNWSQVTENTDVFHDNRFEINQIEKPKFQILPLNILSNFDHATALDNSQGFDITNAMITGYVPEGSLVSTTAPLLSSSTNYIISSTVKPQLGISSTTPEVIAGQSSFHNPVQAVLMPQKLQQNMFNQYLQNTVSPTVFAVTHRPDYSNSNIVPNLQQMLSQQLINAKPIHQSLNNILQPTQSNINTPFYVSPNSVQKQNLYTHQNTQSTQTPSNFNDYQSKKKKLKNNNGEFLASASLSVDSNTKDHGADIKSNTNVYNYYDSQNNQQRPLNTLIQSTVVPAILHTGIGLLSNQNPQILSNHLFLTNPQSNQIINIANNALQNTMKQLHYDVQNNRYQLASISGIDSNTAASNTVEINNNIINPLQKAQLPLLGTNNVEIINPNLSANPYTINQIPATLVTTQIPIFTTAGLLASKQSVSSAPQHSADNKPLYNPINFVPNYDLIKNQTILNSNIVRNNNKKQNFIPLVSIGNIYKNLQNNEDDLIDRPRISLDLEKYAEEMFKESLRTIYNSHKWNNDPRSIKNLTMADNSDLAKLRHELLRIKNNIRDSKLHTDILEAHQTENKIRTTNPEFRHKRPDVPINRYKYSKKPHSLHHSHKNRPKINDFLTPPKVNSFILKNPLHEKAPKKRPSPRHRYNSRLRPRQGIVSPQYKGMDAKTSAITEHKYPMRSNQDHNPYSKPTTLQDYDGTAYSYSPLIGSASENDKFKLSSEYSSVEKNSFGINHQRTHNLMGLLMKNKQLPPGVNNNYSQREEGDIFINQEKKKVKEQDDENGFRPIYPLSF